MAKPRLLVTGFSAFPGAPRNPTEVLISSLEIGRLARRLDIDLAATILPVEYKAVSKLLPKLWKDIKPDAVVHFGLHGEAKTVRIETRAANYRTPIKPDAAGVTPKRTAIEAGGPDFRRVTLPTERLVVALGRAGVPARTSIDAGGYLCNFATWTSLVSATSKKGRVKGLSGFVHVPWPGEVSAPNAPSGRPGWATLSQAVETAIAVTAHAARQRG